MGFYGSIFIIAICIRLALGIDNPEDFVNLLAGSFTDGNVYSTGNTLPLVGYPWGFNHWAPQTRENGRNTGSWCSGVRNIALLGLGALISQVLGSGTGDGFLLGLS